MRFVRYKKLYNMRFDIPSKAIKMYMYVLVLSSQYTLYYKMVYVNIFIKSPPSMCSGGDLLFFAESARRRILFLLSLRNPCLNICSMHTGPGEFVWYFFFAFFSFFSKIQDSRQNTMLSLELDPLHGFVSPLV